MGKGFKHGSGSSDVLNLKIVGGTTRPSNPRENTIWVNTTYDVSAWDISPTEPPVVGNAAGHVWLKIDQKGTMFLNALKKNSIVVQLGGAYVFSNGGWVESDAQVYQNGAWNPLVIPWDGYYFKDGDQYEAITGGWTSAGWYSNGNVSIGDTIVLSAPIRQYSTIATARLVDLTDVDTLWYDSPNGNNGYSSGFLCVTKTKSFSSSDLEASTVVRTAGVGSLDVSGLSGEHYICLFAGGSENAAAYLDIRAIWME